jgi:hypothetical protein
MFIRRSIEVLALILGVGIAVFFSRASWHTEYSEQGHGTFKAVLESRQHENRGVKSGETTDSALQRAQLDRSRKGNGVTRYQTPTSAPTSSTVAEQEQLATARNIGDRISPEDAVFSSSAEVVNIGDWMDPDDASFWQPVENPPVRNIGVYLDPDTPY